MHQEEISGRRRVVAAPACTLQCTRAKRERPTPTWRGTAWDHTGSQHLGPSYTPPRHGLRAHEDQAARRSQERDHRRRTPASPAAPLLEVHDAPPTRSRTVHPHAPWRSRITAGRETHWGRRASQSERAIPFRETRPSAAGVSSAPHPRKGGEAPGKIESRPNPKPGEGRKTSRCRRGKTDQGGVSPPLCEGRVAPRRWLPLT